MNRLLAHGVARIVAVWAIAEALGSQRYQQLEGPESFDLRRLFAGCDYEILPDAFDASAGGFGPAHERLIDYYHRHFDPDGSMSFPVAAGFCFGCATSPKFVRNHTLYEHMFGNELAERTPVYLPVASAYRELFRFVSDAVFEQENPIPDSLRPPADPEACFEAPFSDWCRGFAASQPLVAPGWEEHLAGHPALRERYRAIADTLRFFGGRDQAQALLGESATAETVEAAARRARADLDDAIPRLFRLAHPITTGENRDKAD